MDGGRAEMQMDVTRQHIASAEAFGLLFTRNRILNPVVGRNVGVVGKTGIVEAMSAHGETCGPDQAIAR